MKAMQAINFDTPNWKRVVEQPIGQIFTTCRRYSKYHDQQAGPVILKETDTNLHHPGYIDGVLNIECFALAPRWPIELSLRDDLQDLADALEACYGDDFDVNSPVTFLFLRKT